MKDLLSRLNAQSTLGDLPAHELALDLATRGEVLAGLFERYPELPGVVVTEAGAVRGVLSRGQYLRLVSRYLGHEVYHPRPIRHMFEALENLEKPLMIDAALPIQEAVALAVGRPRALLYEPLIVRRGNTLGNALSLVDFPDLLLADAHISALRNQQMRQILGTVQEGFLLVGRDEKVAAEYSDWVKSLFGPVDIAGQPFDRLLALLLGEEKASLGREYVLTLFDPNVMERWVADINPLKKVEAELNGTLRHLAFRFVRSRRDGRIDRILVRIEDQSREVELARELEAQEIKARERVDLVFALLSVDPDSLAAFLTSLDTGLALVGRQLASPELSTERLRAVARTLHAIKGEAGLLGLMRLARELHSFEDLLLEVRAAADPLTRKPALAARLADFAQLATEIRTTLEQLGRLGKIGNKAAATQAAPTLAAATVAAPPARPENAVEAPAPETRTAAPAPPSRLLILSRQVEELAQRLGKEARFLCRVSDEDIPIEYRPAVEKALVQLARNSLVHGLESPEERRQLGKPPAGTLQLALRSHPAHAQLELVFQDDGRGLELDKIRRRAEALGLQGLGPAELPGLIFHPGFSTADEQTLEAGRGVGLDLVKAEVEALGGRIVAHSRPGAFCAFQILLPALPGLPRLAERPAATAATAATAANAVRNV